METILISVIGFFISWIAWTILSVGILGIIQALTGYDWQIGEKGWKDWSLFCSYVGGFALFIGLTK